MEQTLINFGKFDYIKETGENFSVNKIVNSEAQ